VGGGLVVGIAEDEVEGGYVDCVRREVRRGEGPRRRGDEGCWFLLRGKMSEAMWRVGGEIIQVLSLGKRCIACYGLGRYSIHDIYAIMGSL
jgi:hypothetical protein